MNTLCVAFSIACPTISVSAYTIMVLLNRKWNHNRHQNDELTTRLLKQPEKEGRKLCHFSEETHYPNICVDEAMVLDENEKHIVKGGDRDLETGYAMFF